MKEKDAIPYVPGEPAPIGYVKATIDGTGELVWMHLDSLKIDESPQSDLSDEQEKRIKALWRGSFREHCWEALTLKQALDGFRSDRHPEREIQLWEAMQLVYDLELEERGEMPKAERELLFVAIQNFGFGHSLNEALGADPRLKRLADLERVAARFSAE